MKGINKESAWNQIDLNRTSEVDGGMDATGNWYVMKIITI